MNQIPVAFTCAVLLATRCFGADVPSTPSPSGLTAPTSTVALGQTNGVAATNVPPSAAKSVPEFKQPGFKVCRDVVYATVDGKPILLDVYMPEAPKDAQPAVVWVHGGGWVTGSKDDCPVKDLIYQGYTVVSINYRLSNATTRFPVQIVDCKGAVRFLRANAATYAIDPNRIGIIGSSAGGHLAALMGTSGGVKELEGDTGGNLDQSSRVQCVVDTCGPTDFVKFAAYNQGGVTGVHNLFGGTITEKMEMAIKASPITYITAGNLPPFLIFHGGKDLGVPLSQSQLLQDALKAAGADSTFIIVPNAGHGNLLGRDALKQIAQFLDSHLKSISPGKPAL